MSSTLKGDKDDKQDSKQGRPVASRRLDLLCVDHPTLTSQDNPVAVQIVIPKRLPPIPAFFMVPIVAPSTEANSDNSTDPLETSYGPWIQPVSYIFVFMLQEGAARVSSLVLRNAGTGVVRIYGATLEQAQEFLKRTAAPPSLTYTSSVSVEERASFFDDEPLSVTRVSGPQLSTAKSTTATTDTKQPNTQHTRLDAWNRKTVGDLVRSWTTLVPDTQLLPSVLVHSASSTPPKPVQHTWTWPIRHPLVATQRTFALLAVECQPLCDLPQPCVQPVHVGLQWFAAYGTPDS